MWSGGRNRRSRCERKSFVASFVLTYNQTWIISDEKDQTFVPPYFLTKYGNIYLRPGAWKVKICSIFRLINQLDIFSLLVVEETPFPSASLATITVIDLNPFIILQTRTPKHFDKREVLSDAAQALQAECPQYSIQHQKILFWNHLGKTLFFT